MRAAVTLKLLSVIASVPQCFLRRSVASRPRGLATAAMGISTRPACPSVRPSHQQTKKAFFPSQQGARGFDPTAGQWLQ